MYSLISYNLASWNLECSSNIGTVEKLQRQYSERLIEQQATSYKQKLIYLDGLSAKVMRYAANMVFIFKIMRDLSPFNISDIGLSIKK